MTNSDTISQDTTFAFSIVVVAAIMFGTVPYFAVSLTQMGIAPPAVAFYRYLIAGMVFLPALWGARRSWPILIWGIGTGICMSLGWLGYVSALRVVPVSTAGVIYMSYPIFTLVIGWLVWGEHPTRRAIMAALLILIAAAIATGVAPIDKTQWVWILAAFAAPLGFGFGITVLVHKLAGIPAMARISAISIGSVVGLLPLVVVLEGPQIFPATSQGWVWVVGIALVTALIPQLLYTYFAPMIGSARTATAGSVELPTMFAIGWLAFGETIGVAQWTTCGLILLSVLLIQARVTRPFFNRATTEKLEP
jgi:drug/metabolite transporter (DMT)-like permease